MSDITPSQTVGPFFAYGLTPHSRCEWWPEQGKDVYNWKETAGAKYKIHGLWPLGNRQECRLQLRHDQTGVSAGPKWQTAGPTRRVLHLLARHVAANLYPPLFRRRGGK